MGRNEMLHIIHQNVDISMHNKKTISKNAEEAYFLDSAIKKVKNLTLSLWESFREKHEKNIFFHLNRTCVSRSLVI